MNADNMKDIFDYHFTLNRKMLDYCEVNLTPEQFEKDVGISQGSIKNLFVHIINTDFRWFSGLCGDVLPDHADPEQYSDYDDIRESMDEVEKNVKSFLFGLDDIRLNEEFESGLNVWQVLFHVVNHGTHHRAQISAILRQLGVEPQPQDFVFYVMNRL